MKGVLLVRVPTLSFKLTLEKDDVSLLLGDGVDHSSLPLTLPITVPGRIRDTG